MEHKGLICVLLVILIILIAIPLIFLGASTTHQDAIIIKSMNIVPDDFGYGYNIIGDINVNKDMNYLEADVKYFDENGQMIEKDLAWNQNSVKKGDSYTISGPLLTQSSIIEKTSYAVIEFHQDFDSNTVLANATINFK